MSEILNWMFSSTTQFFHQVCQFFVSSVCLLERVTMVVKNKAVICCLLVTSAIMLFEKKKLKHKMWSKSGNWNESYHVMLISFIHCGRLSAFRWCHRGIGRLIEETVRFPEWTAQFSVWKTTGKEGSEACATACQDCAVYSVFPSGMTSHIKIAMFNLEFIGHLREIPPLLSWGMADSDICYVMLGKFVFFYPTFYENYSSGSLRHI
jgi:hypothetical protein